MSYLTVLEFQSRTNMPASYVTEIETVQAGWTLAQLEQWSQWIDARLRKRYVIPLPAASEIVKSWLTRIVTLRAFLRRGVDPDDLQFAAIKEDSDTAIAEIKEAADSNEGLFDLPLVNSTDTSAIAKGGPYVYSEASPYVYLDVQRDAATPEDRSRAGTGG